MNQSYIDVHVPSKVTRGDLMEIYAKFIDMKTLKLMKIPNIYLQIISTDDHEYWPTGVIRQNESTLHIAIGHPALSPTIRELAPNNLWLSRPAFYGATDFPIPCALWIN